MLYIIIPKPNMTLLKIVLEPVHFMKIVKTCRVNDHENERVKF